jgi:hypothetical protein
MKQPRPPKRRRKLPPRASKADARSNRPRRAHVEVRGVPGAGTAPVGISIQSTPSEVTSPPPAPHRIPLPGAGHDLDTTAAQIAALRPKVSNAELSISTEPPLVHVIPAPVPVVPTVYPENPATGTVIVQNRITINVDGADFGALITKLDELRAELRRSNEISGEVREKLIAEIDAGTAIARSPKPDRNMIELLLIRPLKYLADKAGSAVISKLATAALELLLRLIGLS